MDSTKKQDCFLRQIREDDNTKDGMMSQEDVMNILKLNKGVWLTSREIANKLSMISKSAVSNNLSRLYEHGDVQGRVVPNTKGVRGCYVYRYGRKRKTKRIAFTSVGEEENEYLVEVIR